MGYKVSTYVNGDKKSTAYFSNGRAAREYFLDLTDRMDRGENHVCVRIEDEQGSVYDTRHFLPQKILTAETREIGESVRGGSNGK